MARPEAQPGSRTVLYGCFVIPVRSIERQRLGQPILTPGMMLRTMVAWGFVIPLSLAVDAVRTVLSA